MGWTAPERRTGPGTSLGVQRGAHRGERSQADLGGRVWWSLAVLAAIGSTVLVLVGLLPVVAGVDEGLSAPSLPGSASAVASAVASDFDAQVLADVSAYRTPRRRVALASRVLAVLVPVLVASLLVGPSGARLIRPLRRLPGIALPVGAALASTVVAVALVRLPLSVWAGVVQDGAWGFRTRSGAGWALDHGGVVLGRALLLGAVTVGVVLLVQRHPRTWPARLTVLAAVGGPLALLLHPLVVHPLLLPTGPLPPGAHRDAVVAVVASSADPDVPVLLGEASLRTTRRNAVVTGLGPTRRIVLHDTLLELDPRQVAAITAHELAHVERRDPLRGVLAPVPVVLLAGLAARRRLARSRQPETPVLAGEVVAGEVLAGEVLAGQVPDPRGTRVRSLAAAAVLVLALEAVSTPFAAGLSRTIEHRTDVRAVALGGDVDAYVAMLRLFVIDGLAEPDPPRWSVLLWATHPTPVTRIAAVLEADAALSGPDGPATR